jgi:hypothetical protein
MSGDALARRRRSLAQFGACPMSDHPPDRKLVVPNGWRRRRSATFVTATLAALCCVSTADAKRPANHVETRAIHRTLERYWTAQNASCQTSSDRFDVGRAYVSTANPHYGYGSVTDNSCTYAFGYFVRRASVHGEAWRVVVAFQDSAQNCSDFRRVLPISVIDEFELRGIGSNGTFGACG